MNRLFYILLTTLITCPAAQAIDLKTNPACKKLVTAINQAQDVSKCTAAWQTITASAAIATQDHAAIIDQALQLAREQKTALEQELNSLGNETKNYSKLKWGAGQLALATYCALGIIYVLSESLAKTKVHHLPGWQFIWPEYWLKNRQGFCDNWCSEDSMNIVIALRFAINLVASPYCLYKAYYNLKHGLNYKKFLQDKIENLDAIISYLQEVQGTH